MLGEPQILRPWHRAEVISVEAAAIEAGRSSRTIREWCSRFDIGRKVGPHYWAVSRIALTMFLEGDKAALAAATEDPRPLPIGLNDATCHSRGGTLRICGALMPGGPGPEGHYDRERSSSEPNSAWL